MHEKTKIACHIAVTALVVLLLVARPVTIAGQQADQSMEFPSFGLQRWSFTPSLAIGTVYDNNVALSSPRADVGETQGDSLLTLIPSGYLEYRGKRTEFSAGYRGFVRRYFEIEGLDEFSQRGGVSFRHLFSRRLTFYVTDSYADMPTTDDVEVNGVPFRRVGSRTNTFAATTDYRLSKFTTLSTRYDTTWVEFDQPEVFLTGGWIHALRNELSHTFTERLSLGAEYSYRTASLNEGTRDFGFQDLGGVVSFGLGRHTSGNAAAGYAVLHDRTNNRTASGPFVRLSVTHAFERATIGGGYQRQYVPTFGFGGATSSQELGGHLMMPFARSRLYAQASGTWRRAMPFEEDALELDTLQLRSTLGYSMTRWARLEGVYVYTRQDSTITGGEVDRHRIGIQFVVSQPMRIR